MPARKSQIDLEFENVFGTVEEEKKVPNHTFCLQPLKKKCLRFTLHNSKDTKHSGVKLRRFFLCKAHCPPVFWLFETQHYTTSRVLDSSPRCG